MQRLLTLHARFRSVKAAFDIFQCKEKMTREHLERALVEGVQWIRLLTEATGAAIVAIGVALALCLYGRSVLSRKHADFNRIRLVLARYLALALEFQLGSDILSTAVNPS